MPVITKITVQKKQTDRYNIFTDDGNGEKYAFSVDEDVLIKYQLKKGVELDELGITEIFYQDDIRKAYQKAVQYLAPRMRSELEVRQHLQKKEIEEPIINEVIHKLNSHQFLDDKEFAYCYVRTQMNTTDKGGGLIIQELKEKGINPEIIEAAILEYPFEAQLEKAMTLAIKNIQKNNKDASLVVKQKLGQLLVRKGYSLDIIQETTSSLDFQKEEEDELATLRKQGDKLIHKYRNYEGYEFSQKLKQALYRKGFAMELIDRYLIEIQDNE